LKEGFIEASRVALIEMALLDNVPPVLVGTVVSEGLEDIALAPSSDGRDEARPAFGELGSPHIANALVALSDDGVVAIAPNDYSRITTSLTSSGTSIRASDRTRSSTFEASPSV